MRQTPALKISSTTASPVSCGLLQRKCACGGTSGLSGECEACRKKRLGMAQRFANGLAPAEAAPPIVHDVLRSPGQPLDPATRAFMEPRFGHDFSRVQVHTDARAAESARAVNALAYTVGRDVVIGAGQYAPQTHAGQQLMAHELTHVVQQGASPGHVPDQLQLNPPGHVTETEASEKAQSIFNSEHTQIRQGGIPVHLQRLQQPLNLLPPGNPCPTSVRLGPMRQYNHGNISLDRRERYRTYLSNIATMIVGPGPDHQGHCMQESLVTVSNNCPAALTAIAMPCSQHDCLPIDTPTSFVDGHVTHSARSFLENTGVSSCSTVCEQTYACDPFGMRQASGVFRITRNYQAGTYRRQDGSDVHITTGTVDKTEVPRAPAQNPIPRVPLPDTPPPRTLPEGSEYA